MPKIVTAHVALDDGTDFVAEIANLTPQSVFVKTDRRLRFREPVTVTFFSVSIAGELAFVSRSDPAGAVIVFSPPAELAALIHARIPEVELLGAEEEAVAAPAPPGVTRRRPARPAPEPLEAAEDVEVHTSPSVVTPELDLVPSPEQELAAPEDFAVSTLVGATAADLGLTAPGIEARPPSPETSARADGASFDARPVPRARDSTRMDKLPAGEVPEPAELPVLEPDGATVVFASHAQFVAQWSSNIAHGALVVRTAPIPVGERRQLAIKITGIWERYRLTCAVVVNTEDTVGFVIDRFPEHEARLARLAKRAAPPAR